MKSSILTTMAILAVIACGTGEPAETTLESSYPDTVVVTVLDTVGVLMGDSLREFGNITDASLVPDGRLLILDGLKARIGVFSPEREFLEFVGRPGSGPGEFQYPRSFALMDDGSLVVSDWGAIAVTFLHGDMSFDTLLTSYSAIPPDRITPCPDGSYVGMSLEHRVENGEPVGDTFLARFGRSEEPGVVYCSYPMRFSLDEDGDLNVHTVGITWDTSDDGSVAVAQTCDSIWAFTAFGPSGEELFSVEKDWERVPKSEEELAEGLYHESLSTSEESGNSMNRDRLHDGQPLYRNAIGSVDIDDMNRIWVGQDWTDHPTFEVYDFQGELLFVAVIPELEGTDGISYCFDNGFIAFDTAPVDYPKVYILEVEN